VKLYVCSYDIPDSKKAAKRRRQLVKVLEAYGQRVQYSVFELRIRNRNQFRELRERIDKILVPEEDSVRIYPIPRDVEEHVIVIGQGELFLLETVLVL